MKSSSNASPKFDSFCMSLISNCLTIIEPFSVSVFILHSFDFNAVIILIYFLPKILLHFLFCPAICH